MYVTRWMARAWWALLPLLAGPAVVGLFASASTPVRTTGYVIAWVFWIAGLAGLVVSREAGYTVLRVLAPLLVIVGFVAGVVAVRDTDVLMLPSAVATIVVGCVSLSGVVLQAQLDAASYGSELRFALKTPPVLWLGPLPLAWACVALAIAVGPLLLAAGSTLWGVAALVVGVPLGALAIRSVHTLSARWLVLVPAGVVVKDPMVLTDPILVPTDHIAALEPTPREPTDTAIDLRLGAIVRSVQIRCTEPTEGMRIRKGRNDTIAVDSDTFLVAPGRPIAFLAEYHARHRARHAR